MGNEHSYLPVPVKLTTWGLFTLKSLIVSEPFRVPVAVGLNSTPTMQWPLAGKLDVQVLLLILKSPLAPMLEMPSALVAGLALLNVTF